MCRYVGGLFCCVRPQDMEADEVERLIDQINSGDLDINRIGHVDPGTFGFIVASCPEKAFDVDPTTSNWKRFALAARAREDITLWDESPPEQSELDEVCVRPTTAYAYIDFIEESARPASVVVRRG